MVARMPEVMPNAESDRPAMLLGSLANTPAALRPYLQRQAEPVPPAAPPAAPLAGRQPAASPGALGSIPASVRMAAARGDRDAQEAIRAYLAGRR